MADLPVHTTDISPWLDPLEVLARACHQLPSGDLAMLHSGPAEGFSVLAIHPLKRVVLTAGPGLLSSLQSEIEAISFEAPHPLIGWLGFVSYDIGSTLEVIPPFAPDERHWPLIGFTLYRHYLLFDVRHRGIRAITLGDSNPPFDWQSLWQHAAPQPPWNKGRIVDALSVEEYLARIRRVKEYISAGDIYQANLAQRWLLESPNDPVDIFRRLCELSPAPFGAFLQLTDGGITRHALSASPELFLTLDQGHIVTRPIKGTRPRDPGNPLNDELLREKLLTSDKDRAELAMIVDLLRNDLGRVARYGSVRVTDPRMIEKHPTVWHTVATIEADMRPDAGLADLLAALCPGGSITGAPKIRAMQIIEELEGFRRALYCGNIGVIGPQGKSAALNIAIRTILLEEGRAQVFAGGGIVADSVPRKEYEETLHKAAAMLQALL